MDRPQLRSRSLVHTQSPPPRRSATLPIARTLQSWRRRVHHRSVAAAVWLIGCSGAGSHVAPLPAPTELQVLIGGGGTESPSFVAATESGGAIVVGTTDSFGVGDTDLWLVEADARGAIQRQPRWGGPSRESVTSVDRTPDGGLAFVVEITQPAGVGDDSELVRLDADWNELWRMPTRGNAVRALANGELALAGASSDALLVRLDASGNELWRNELQGATDESATAVAEGPGDDLYVCTKRSGGVRIARLTGSGQLRFSTPIASLDSEAAETFRSLRVQADGSAVAVGHSLETYIDSHGFLQSIIKPVFVRLAADGTVNAHRYLDDGRSPILVDSLPRPGGGLDVLASQSLLVVSDGGDLVAATQLPTVGVSFAPTSVGGHWILGSDSQHAWGQTDLLLAKANATGDVGPPPEPPSFAPATSFGAVESVATVDDSTVGLGLAGTEGLAGGSVVAWPLDPGEAGIPSIESAWRNAAGTWIASRVASSRARSLRLASPSPGTAFAAWGARDGGVLVSRLDPARGWDPVPATLDSKISAVNPPSLAANARGDAVVVWLRDSLGDEPLAASRFDAASGRWSEPVDLPGALVPVSPSGPAPRVVLDAAGRALVMWHSDFAIHAVRGDEDGSWHDLGIVASDTQSLDTVALVANANGDTLAVWSAFHGGGSTIHTLWFREGQPIGTVARVADVHVDASHHVQAAVSDDGHGVLAWVSHLVPLAAESVAGAPWSTPIAHPAPDAAGADLVSITPLDADEFLAAWSEYRGRSTVWASRYRLGGRWADAEYLGDTTFDPVGSDRSVAWQSSASGDRAQLVARTAR